jgi:TPR repeat protein
MYDIGSGVKQDYGEASRWFRKAAAQGYKGAKKAVLRAEEELRKQYQAAPVTQPLTCANCGIAGTAGGGALKPCSRCKAVVYCGKECQAKHWKTRGHKAECK